jgi:hypothetical protein
MNNEAVIKRISDNFVPVAVNIYRMRGEDPASQFFQSIQKQKYSYQGVWIVDPAGNVTLMGLGEKNLEVRIKQFIADLDKTVEAFGVMKPRFVKWQDPLPWRGVGVKPDGKVTLALYVRHCSAREWETFTPPKSLPGIDSITFDAEEWATFTPARVEVGATWKIPDAVVRKFNRGVDGIWDVSVKPEHAKLAQLQAVVEAVEGKQARIRLTGNVESSWIKPFNNPNKKTTYAWCDLEGTALYDVEKKALSSMTLLFRGGLPEDPRDKETGTPLAGFAEWSQAKSEPPPAKP